MDAAGPVDAQNAPTGPWITADGYPRAPTATIGYVKRFKYDRPSTAGGPHFGITGGPDFVDKRTRGGAFVVGDDFDREHNAGTITTTRPNVMWGTDATRFYTERDGRCWWFGGIDHASDDIVGWHVANIGDRWAALPHRKANQL